MGAAGNGRQPPGAQAGWAATAADSQAQGQAPGPDPCAQGSGHPPCCPLYHEAVELIGRRWTGAIVSVLIHRTTLRFGEIADSVPELSDRLLSERMKELEARGVVDPDGPSRPPGARRVRAHRHGSRARARRARARGLGAPLARAALRKTPPRASAAPPARRAAGPPPRALASPGTREKLPKPG